MTDEELNLLKFTNLILRLVPRAVRVLFDKKLLSSSGRRCRDRVVVGFTTTYAISAYHH